MPRLVLPPIYATEKVNVLIIVLNRLRELDKKARGIDNLGHFSVWYRIVNQGISSGPEPTISVSVVHSLCDLLSEHQGLVREGLARFEIEIADKHDVNARVSMRGYLGFFEWLACELERPFLGLELSQRAGPDMLGAVGYLFLSSVNLEVALTRLVQYSLAVQDNTSPTPRKLLVASDYIKLNYSVLNDQITEARQDAEFTTGFDWRIIQTFCGRVASLVRVDFEHDRPAYAQSDYHRVFPAPVFFGQASNALYLPRSLLAARPVNVDPHLSPILDAHLRAIVSRRAQVEKFSDQVRACLTQEIMRQGARAIVVAGLLGLSKSALQRRLRAEDTTFKTLVDENSMLLASTWIRQSQVPVSAIARRLGYAETACLTRAFRRWYGVSPREYRRAISDTPVV